MMAADRPRGSVLVQPEQDVLIAGPRERNVPPSLLRPFMRGRSTLGATATTADSQPGLVEVPILRPRYDSAPIQEVSVFAWCKTLISLYDTPGYSARVPMRTFGGRRFP